MKIYCDGSLKEYCFVVDDEQGHEEVFRGEHCNPQTNNSSEYHAVINAMTWAEHHEVYDNIEFMTDSKLVVEQILSGTKPEYVWKCKKTHLKILRDIARMLITYFTDNGNKEWDEVLKWTPREQNKAGIILG